MTGGPVIDDDSQRLLVSRRSAIAGLSGLKDQLIRAFDMSQPDRLTLDPAVPATPAGDLAFGLVVDWTVHALVEAEALGITQANLATSGAMRDTRTDELMGRDFATAQALGLQHDWAAKVIAATGNYGEIFERSLGRPYGLERGLNALWTQGGLMRPFPMR
jgi:general L-amino acid transport system substrate-binding protein